MGKQGENLGGVAKQNKKQIKQMILEILKRKSIQKTADSGGFSILQGLTKVLKSDNFLPVDIVLWQRKLNTDPELIS